MINLMPERGPKVYMHFLKGLQTSHINSVPGLLVSTNQKTVDLAKDPLGTWEHQGDKVSALNLTYVSGEMVGCIQFWAEPRKYSQASPIKFRRPFEILRAKSRGH